MKRTLTILTGFVLALAAPLRAQVSKGEASMNLNGTISAGYGDDYSNIAGSDHSIFGAGVADLSGSYFNPNFLSFDVQPFYNQSRLNSTFQSITAASGVSADAKIFSGSPYPGSISYSSTFNSSGNYGIPGLANYITHGNNDVLALTWGVHLKDLPSLNLNFSDANNAYSLYGAQTLGRLHDDTFSATSAYRIAGFNLNGGYQHTGTQSVTPEFLADEAQERTDSGANSFFFGVGHNLPWKGSISAGAVHEEINVSLDDAGSTDNYKTSIDTFTGGLNFNPLSRLIVGESTYYTDNLEGTLYNTLLTAGAVAPQSETQQSSHALSLTGYASYDMPAQHLYFHAFIERQQQTFLDTAFASDSYNGTATYTNRLLGGQFNGVLGLTRSSVEPTHQTLLGLNSSVSYSHPIQRWTVGGGFAYSQDTQTVLIAYTTSGYNYFGNASRKIGRRAYWGVYASGARSLLTGVPGSANSSQSYSTSLSLPRFSLNGSYSESSGNALLTPTGLVPNPVPLPVVNPAAVVLFNGKSYSAGVGSTPIRGLILSAIYAKALSGTNSSSTVSNNNNENMYFLMTYQLRKLNFQAGYSRLVQGFSVAGTPQTVAGSFFVGISRWFNFF